MLVLSNTRGLLNKKEAVDVAYYFISHNGTVFATNNPLSTMIQTRNTNYILELKESILKHKNMYSPVVVSLNKLFSSA